jgi:hypothetical protein
VLPIRPDGSRPAFHQIGANAVATSDLPLEALRAIEGADHLHVGAPEFYGEDVITLLRVAREHGTSTSADCLAPGLPDYFPLIEPVLPYVDYFLPNGEQAMGWTQTKDPESAGRHRGAHHRDRLHRERDRSPDRSARRMDETAPVTGPGGAVAGPGPNRPGAAGGWTSDYEREGSTFDWRNKFRIAV